MKKDTVNFLNKLNESEKPTKIKITKNNMREIPVKKGNIKATPSIEREMKNKKKLKEESYNDNIYKRIEEALQDAGFTVDRYTDAGVLTRNLGWIVYDSSGEVNLTCDGTWLDDEDLEECDKTKKINESKVYRDSESPSDYIVLSDSGELEKTSAGEVINFGKVCGFNKVNNTTYLVVKDDDSKVYLYSIDTGFPFTFSLASESTNESEEMLKEALVPVSELPDMCYSVLPSDCSIIIIKKGETGYYLTNKGYEREYADIENWDEKNNKADEICNKLNDQLGVTPEQRQSMEVRSMFGNWND